VNAYRRATVALAVALAGLGVAMIAVTAANGGGETGFLLGGLFVAVGVLRLYAERAR
jgi:hypothetical protein